MFFFPGLHIHLAAASGVGIDVAVVLSDSPLGCEDSASTLVLTVSTYYVPDKTRTSDWLEQNNMESMHLIGEYLHAICLFLSGKFQV